MGRENTHRWCIAKPKAAVSRPSFKGWRYSKSRSHAERSLARVARLLHPSSYENLWTVVENGNLEIVNFGAEDALGYIERIQTKEKRRAVNGKRN